MEYILGVFASLLVQWLKFKYETRPIISMAILLGVCLVAAGLYTLLSSVGMWEGTAHILVAAGAFYSFVVRRFES